MERDSVGHVIDSPYWASQAYPIENKIDIGGPFCGSFFLLAAADTAHGLSFASFFLYQRINS